MKSLDDLEINQVLTTLNVTEKKGRESGELEEFLDWINIFLDFLPLPGKSLMLKGVYKIYQLIVENQYNEVNILKENEFLDILNQFDEEGFDIDENPELTDLIIEKNKKIEELEKNNKLLSDDKLSALSALQDIFDLRNLYYEVGDSGDSPPDGISLFDYFIDLFYRQINIDLIDDLITIIDNRKDYDKP